MSGDYPGWIDLAAEIVAIGIIAAGLAQVLLYLVQLIYAGWALHRRPPAESPALLWQRYADLAPPIAVSGTT